MAETLIKGAYHRAYTRVKMLDKEDEAEGKKDKCETVELDAAGMPIMEYSRNMANGPKKDDVDPPSDENGERGWKNPQGKAKRPRGGDRRPNVKGRPDMPFDDGTVPNGAGVYIKVQFIG